VAPHLDDIIIYKGVAVYVPQYKIILIYLNLVDITTTYKRKEPTHLKQYECRCGRLKDV